MITIRKIERGDLDQLVALDRICFRPGIAYSKAELNFYIRHPRSLAFAAVDSDNTLLGFAIVEWAAQDGHRLGHIVTIDVVPDRRRNGVGHSLMQAMVDGLVDMEADALRLEVAVDNLEAQAFYRRHGFTETGRIPGYYLGTLDALAMQRSLAPDPHLT